MAFAEQGKIAELKVTQDLLLKGYEVFLPVLDSSRADLIAIRDSEVLKVQVKSTSTNNGIATLVINKVRRNSSKGNFLSPYLPEEIDLFALHICDLDKIAYIKLKDIDVRYTVTFRTSPSKNNQIKDVRYLEDYLKF